MSEPLRISLRLLGTAMFLGGNALLLSLITPGPTEVAGWMGQSCRRSKNGPSETCTVGDVIEIALAAPLVILIGFVLMLSLRPPGKGPFTLDFSGGRQ